MKLKLACDDQDLFIISEPHATGIVKLLRLNFKNNLFFFELGHKCQGVLSNFSGSDFSKKGKKHIMQILSNWTNTNSAEERKKEKYLLWGPISTEIFKVKHNKCYWVHTDGLEKGEK